MDKTIAPSTDLEFVLKNTALSSLSTDYAEIISDGVMDDGILKDLPLVGTAIGGIKFANSLNRHFTAKKLYKFLFQLNSIPQEKRTLKINEINSSKEYSSSVGEIIFEIIDKIESDGKPEIIGRLFASFIQEKIDFKTYLKLSHIVKNIFYFDLILLQNYDNDGYIYEGSSEQLLSLGLIEIFVIDEWSGPRAPKDPPSGRITSLGKMIVDLGMR